MDQKLPKRCSNDRADSIVKPMENEENAQKEHIILSKYFKKPYKTLLKCAFGSEMDVIFARIYCKTNGKWYILRKRYLKSDPFHCAARRIWPKWVQKRVQNGSKPYKTNGKPPNELSREYFLVGIFFWISKKYFIQEKIPGRARLVILH